jgi:membrane associated rhomboid family serine protease
LGQLWPGLYSRLALQPRGKRPWQILSYHWVHGDWRHLFFNCLALLALATVIVIWDEQHFFPISLIVLLSAGCGTWLFSTATQVAGASGLVFGYWGFIICAAAISREPGWTAAAAITLLFYSGLGASLSNVVKGVSWSGHFWGLAGGALAAGLLYG